MNLLRNLISSTIVFILVPALTFLIFLSSITAILLNTKEFNSTLKQNVTYSKIASQIAPLILSQNFSVNPHEQEITKQVLQKIAVENSVRLQKDLETLTVNLHQYLTTSETNFEVKIDLSPYRQTLETDLETVLTKEYSTLPLCTKEELSELRASQSGEIPFCQEPNIKASDLAKNISFGNSIATLLPDTLIMNKDGITTQPQLNLETSQNNTLVLNNQKSSDSLFIKAKNAIATVEGMQSFLLVLVLFLLVCLFISRLKRVTESFSWIGGALLSASFLPLILGFAGTYFLKPSFFQQILDQSTGSAIKLSSQTTSLVSEVLFSFIRSILNQVKFESLGVFVVAVLFLSLSKLLKFKTFHKKTIDSLNKEVG